MWLDIKSDDAAHSCSLSVCSGLLPRRSQSKCWFCTGLRHFMELPRGAIMRLLPFQIDILQPHTPCFEGSRQQAQCKFCSVGVHVYQAGLQRASSREVGATGVIDDVAMELVRRLSQEDCSRNSPFVRNPQLTSRRSQLFHLANSERSCLRNAHKQRS